MARTCCGLAAAAPRHAALLFTALLFTALLFTAQVGSSFGDVDKARASLAFAASESSSYGSLAKVGAVPELLSQEKAARFSQSISELKQARRSVAQQRARQTPFPSSLARRPALIVA